MEQKAESLAACLLALAWLARERGGAAALSLLAAHAKHKAAAVRVAAAIGGSWLDGSPARTRALAATVPKAPTAAAVPFGHGDLRGLAVAQIAARSMQGGNADAFLDLNAELDLLPDRELYEVVLAAIVPALAKRPVEPPLASDFSDEQRRVLVRLAEHVAVARSKNEHVPLDAFDARGIMDPVRLLGVGAGGPLDDLVDGEPLWRHARRARDGRGEVSRWTAIVKRWTQGDAKKCEALAKDCFANGYCLSMPYPYAYDRPIAEQWKENEAWGAVLRATLDGVAPALLGELACGTTRAAAYAVGPWIAALEGKLDASAKKTVLAILSSVVPERSVGRAVLEALAPSAREELADKCAFDVLVANGERPPRVYLRGAWQWLDLSPALTMLACKQVASWSEVPEAAAMPRVEEAIVAEVVRLLGGAKSARSCAKSLLGDAKLAGRRVLEQVIAPPTD